jgi:hypothetical protein
VRRLILSQVQAFLYVMRQLMALKTVVSGLGGAAEYLLCLGGHG